MFSGERSDDAVDRRAVLAGLATGAGVALAGCSQGTGSETTTTATPSVTFQHVPFNADMTPLKSEFNEAHPNVDLTLTLQDSGSTSDHDHYVNKFVSGSTEFDAGMMDVVWPKEFAESGWLEPIADSKNRTEKMVSTQVDAVTIDGTLYGMPIFTDANGLYYRTDLLEKGGYDSPPETYTEMRNMIETIDDAVDRDLNGYLFHGAKGEGLTISWFSFLWALDGSARDDDGDLKVNSSKGVDALRTMYDFIYEHGVTPETVVNNGIDGSRTVFQKGDTIFMSNWPYARGIYQSDTPVTGKFDVASKPSVEGYTDVDNSCLGGWALFISDFSQNKAAAQKLADWFGSKEAQELLPTTYSFLPAREELYEDGYWADRTTTTSGSGKPELLEVFGKLRNETNARPATTQYATFSRLLYTQCHKALSDEKGVQEALDDAQADIDEEINDASPGTTTT